MRKLLLVILASLFLTFSAQSVAAQEEKDLAKKYNISFPVKELGNCKNLNECKAYCNDSKNQDACISFAKKKGFYQEHQVLVSEEKILELAKEELGCSSYDLCMAFCEKEENMEKCMDFAAKHNLDGGNAAQMQQQMSALKNLLGCNSMKACMDLCNNPANMQKCMEVFKQAGFSVEANYSGPGGCSSEQSCQAYCEKNPKECGGENYQSEPPEVWCSKVSSDCKWDGTTCICGGTNSPQESGEIWCPKAGPDCKWTGITCECRGQNYTEGSPPGTDPTEWCKQNPGKCTYQNTGDSSAECAKYGCTFDGKTCQCPNSSSVSNVDFGDECLRQSGCSWDATTKICSCSTEITAPPSTPGPGDAAYECQKLGGVWDGIDCRSQSPTPQVQGVSTSESLFQKILNFLLGRTHSEDYQLNNPSKRQFSNSSSGEGEQDFFADIAHLPSCGNKKELFSISPLKLTDFKGIVPLGTLAPTSHVLPTHHLYFHPRREDPRNFNSLPVEVPVVAPADITITEIRFTETKERPDFNDGVVHFSPCKEVKALFDHFKTFSPILQKAYDAGEIIRCDEYQRSYQKFGTITFKLCNKKVNIKVKAGQQLGTAGGGEGQMVFDFGLFDNRVNPGTLANPKRWLGQEYKRFTVCPLDYYTPELRQELKSRLGTPDGERKRTVEPTCGIANWDLPGTAQGAWIAKGEEYVAHENPHLALAYDNTDPTIGVISMGNSAENKGFSWGTYNFKPKNTGLVNRDFKEIKADRNAYCFETQDSYHNNAQTAIILQMPTPETLKIEKLNQTSCGSGPWQMKNYAEFYR